MCHMVSSKTVEVKPKQQEKMERQIRQHKGNKITKRYNYNRLVFLVIEYMAKHIVWSFIQYTDALEKVL